MVKVYLWMENSVSLIKMKMGFLFYPNRRESHNIATYVEVHLALTPNVTVWDGDSVQIVKSSKNGNVLSSMYRSQIKKSQI